MTPIPASPSARSPRPARRARLARAVVLALLAAVFALNALSSWGLWGDAIIDCGRELDVPFQLSSGKLLYRDVRYWYGPLAPTLNAWLFRLAGAHTQTLTAAGLVTALLVTWLTYRTTRLFCGRLPATAAAAGFLCVCAFAHLTRLNAFNFVLPYAFAATYGILLALTSVYFLLRHVRQGRDRDFALAAAALALVLLTKIEPAFACAAAHTVFLLARVIGRFPWRPVHLVGYTAALLTPAVTYGRYVAICGPAVWSDNLFLPGNLSANVFSLRHSGLDAPLDSLIQTTASAAALGTALLIIAAVQRAMDRRGGAAPWGASRRLLPALLAAAPAIATAALLGTGRAFAGTPVLLLAGVAVILGGRRRGASTFQAATAEFLLLGFAAAAIARMGLRCQSAHYGFYLLPPALVALTVFAARILPRALAQLPRPSANTPAGAAASIARRTVGAETGRLAGAATAAWLATVSVTHFVQSRAIDAAVFGESPRWAVGPRGRLPVQEVQVGATDVAAEWLAGRAASVGVVVFPEGAGLTFIAGAINPLGVHTFLPLDFSGQYSEDALIQRLAAAGPPYILVTDRSVGEYGADEFGVDYAQRLAQWIGEKYVPAARFAAETYAVHVLMKR